MKFDPRRLVDVFRGSGTTVPAAPSFGTEPDATARATAVRDARKPMIAGGIIVAVGVFGLGLWAAVAPINSAVVAPGQFRVEANRQILKSREGGTVRAIHVRDGDAVRAGQLLLQFDDTVAQAQMEVLTNQHDVVLMQRARFAAEVRGLRSVPVPAELQARRSDPAVSAIINNETLVFTSRLAQIEGQNAILNQRFEQLRAARGGLDVQIRSIDEQVGFITQELDGYRTLNEKGFAPRNLVLRYERQLAEIAGRRGALAADIQRNAQQAGETRLQIAQLYEQRQSEAATGLREAETRLADIAPRLDAARLSLADTRVVAPTAGYILNLSQYTVGGVAQPGETLLDIVPSDAPLVITAQVRPADIDEVTVGMTAQVTLSAYSSQKVQPIDAEVITVSADALTNADGVPYFTADLRIPPEELRQLPPGVRITPGMQATAMILTGRRTVLSYFLQPIGDIANASLRES
jgi:HlyD family secretion protein/epimerase transport system membrane fusion protein